MKNLLFIIATFVCIKTFGQNTHNECVAVFHGDSMIVDDFSPRGKSIIAKSSHGNLSVNMVEIEDDIIKGKAVSFYLAIKDSETQTLTMWSKTESKSIDLGSILSKSNIGDKLVIILSKNKYSLPTEQHEILIAE